MIAIVMTRCEGDLGSVLSARVIAAALGSRLATDTVCVVADTRVVSHRFDVGVPMVTPEVVPRLARRLTACWLQVECTDAGGRELARRIGRFVPLVTCGGGDPVDQEPAIVADERLLRDLGPAVDHRTTAMRLRFLREIGLAPATPFDLELVRTGVSAHDASTGTVRIAYGGEGQNGHGRPPSIVSTEDVLALARAAHTVRVDEPALAARFATIGRVVVPLNGTPARRAGPARPSWDAIAAMIARGGAG